MNDGISLMSAMMIQGNETSVGVYSNKEKTGYGFIIYLMKEGMIHTEIIGTDPYFPFTSEKDAQTYGDNLVKSVRAMDLTLHRNKLEEMMGPETTKAVSEVVRMSKEPNPNP